MAFIEREHFWGTFSVVGKGRSNFPLRFRRRIYTTKIGTTIIIYYKESNGQEEQATTPAGGVRQNP